MTKAILYSKERPDIHKYKSVPKFVSDMLGFLRHSERNFSVNSAVKEFPNCTRGHVNNVAKGRRRLTRELIEAFASVLRLSPSERRYLDDWVAEQKRPPAPSSLDKYSPTRRKHDNSYVSDWLHIYVAEAARLRDFQPDPTVVRRLISGIAKEYRIKRSLKFLFKHGYLKRTLDGKKVTRDEPIAFTTDDIPSKSIATLNKRSLEIAKEGIDKYEVKKRVNLTSVMTIDRKNVDKIKNILSDCRERLVDFEKEYPNEQEGLYQINISFTPIGGQIGDEN